MHCNTGGLGYEMHDRESALVQDATKQVWANEDKDGGDPPRLWSASGLYPGTAFTRSIGDACRPLPIQPHRAQASHANMPACHGQHGSSATILV